MLYTLIVAVPISASAASLLLLAAKAAKIDLAPLKRNFQTIIQYGCDDFLQKKHQADAQYFPIVREIIFSADSHQTNTRAPNDPPQAAATPKTPKRRALAAAAAAVAEPAKTNPAESRVPGYIPLKGWNAGLFYHHNAKAQKARIGAEDFTLFDAIRHTLNTNPTVHAADSKELGFKRVGASEKDFQDCDLKYKLKGRILGKMRLGIKIRIPTDAEKRLLGTSDIEIASPTVFRNK